MLSGNETVEEDIFLEFCCKFRLMFHNVLGFLIVLIDDKQWR